MTFSFRSIALTVLLSLSFITFAQAQAPAQDSTLLQLEKAGKYKEAIEILQQKPSYDAYYFYNLGTLWAKLNQPGLATAYLEKANRLNPHDSDIMKNLKFARATLTTQLGPLDVVSTEIERFSDRIQNDEILGILGLVVLIVSLFWIRAYLKTRNITKTFLKPSGWFGAFAVMISFALYGVYKTGCLNPPAVLILKQPLRSGPGITYPEITSIEPGIRVRIVGSAIAVNENELWQKIRYKSDQAGWIPLSGLLPL